MFGRKKKAAAPATGLRAAAPGQIPTGDAMTVGGIRLDAGHVLHSDFGDPGPARAWLSASPVTADDWRRVAMEFPATGLWPLMADGLDGELARPWLDGEFDDAQPVDGIDALTVLRDRWHEIDAGPWPGPAAGSPGPAGLGSAGDFAPDRAQGLLLVPATRPADAVASLGWSGAVNHDLGGGQISAVLRSWEDRFGAVLVHLTFDTIYLAVSRPPTAPDEVARLAAEHFAFCPDNVWQGTATLAAYREGIAGLRTWAFWWD